MEDFAREAVARFVAVQVREDAPAIALVAAVREQVDGLRNAAKLGDRPTQHGRTTPGLEDAHEIRGRDAAEHERACNSEDVVPVVGDELEVELVAGDAVEGP